MNVDDDDDDDDERITLTWQKS